METCSAAPRAAAVRPPPDNDDTPGSVLGGESTSLAFCIAPIVRSDPRFCATSTGGVTSIAADGVTEAAAAGEGKDVGCGDIYGPATTAMAGAGGGSSGGDDESELDDVSCIAIAAGEITTTTTTVRLITYESATFRWPHKGATGRRPMGPGPALLGAAAAGQGLA